jgi:hypothetical protein
MKVPLVFGLVLATFTSSVPARGLTAPAAASAASIVASVLSFQKRTELSNPRSPVL